MKIAFISAMEGYPWGGSEHLWHRTALHLAAEGHDVIASVKAWGDAEHPAVRELEAKGVRVFRRGPLPPPPWHGRIARRWRRWRDGPTIAPAFSEIAAKRPDVVLFSLGGGFPAIDLCGAILRDRLPFAVLFQAAAEQWWPDDAARARILPALNAARALFFVSHANRRLVERQAVFAHPRAAIVRNPATVPYDVALPWPATSTPARLAFVGRLDPGAKGCDVLLETLALPHWRERDLTVSFFGAGPAAENMRELARLRGLERVAFHGHVADVTAIWREHHALVLPSRFEGLPLVLVEAMLCGRPCIVTDVGGNAELLEDGVTGFVAAAPTVEQFDRALDRAWQQRAHWAAMGAQAARTIREQVPPAPERDFAAQVLDLAR